MPNQTFNEVLMGTLMTVAAEIYKESQKRVPVDSGQLKRSGSINHYGVLNKVSVVKYDVPYADVINRTQEETSGKAWLGLRNKKMTVKRHKRIYPSGTTVMVKEHKKNVGSRPAGKGNGFLEKATEKVLGNFDSIIRKRFPDGEIIVRSM